MAQSVLMVYEDFKSLKDKKNYWKKYIEFYEKYWDSPATPKSSWWGREYQEFRESLSNQLGLEEKHIQDCFFIKDDEGNYYICPIGSEINLNIYSCENFIPFEWFLIFDSEEKRFFYTHTGYGAIHHDSIYYRSNTEKSIKRLDEADTIVKKTLNFLGKDINKYPGLQKLNSINEGISNIKEWLKGFSSSGITLLNYGEICSFIEQESMKNEDSVGELNTILEKLKDNDLSTAESNLKLLDFKWADINNKASGEIEVSPIH